MEAAGAHERKGSGRASHIRSLVPMHACIDGSLLTAADSTGGGSFVNDPRGKQPYNCKFVIRQQTEGVSRTGFEILERCFVIAITDIRRGDELYVSYGKDFWL